MCVCACGVSFALVNQEMRLITKMILFHQVGIVAINVIGDSARKQADPTDPVSVLCFPLLSVCRFALCPLPPLTFPSLSPFLSRLPSLLQWDCPPFHFRGFCLAQLGMTGNVNGNDS